MASSVSYLLVLVLFISTSHPIPVRGPKLLLISFDGFRWDYLTKTETPNFDRIINSGVKAKWIKDTFTSLTFPNHYTIVTGLYEESHGIIANVFYDPDFKEVFDIENRTTVTDGKFWGGEPIWVTNQLQGGESGSYYWVGSEAEIRGVRPTYFKIYQKENSTKPILEKRVDSVIKWLTDSNPEVNLALLYFREPDWSGHHFGPDSPEVVDVIRQCDNITGYLLDKLEENNLIDDLNIIITSDHGMTNMSKDRFVTLDDHIDVSKTEHLLNYFVGTSVWPIQDNAGVTEDLYKNLSSINEHISVWNRDEIPPEYHYSHNKRVPPILLAADNGWGIKRNWSNPNYFLGRHGFNNSEMDMHPFFLAKGPVFKKSFISEPFENVHIYELMCHILKLKPAPNNGSIEAVRHLLLASDNYNAYLIGKWTGICIAILMAIISIIFVMKELCRLPRNHYRNRTPLLFDNNGEDQESLLT